MTAIGSLLFCDDCGNLLPSRTSSKEIMIKCGVCGASCKDTSSKVVVTKSNPSEYPSILRQKRSKVQPLDEEEGPKGALTNTPCEKCGEQEVRFYTQQLRSADEGSTVFYDCPNCHHKWQENN